MAKKREQKKEKNENDDVVLRGEKGTGASATERDGTENDGHWSAFSRVLRQIDANGIAETVWSEPTGERIEAPMQSVREKRRASKMHSM